MIAHYNRRSLALGVPGLVFQVAPILHDALPPHGEWLHVLTGLIVFAGWVMLVVGLCYYALAKGYSKWLGLLGLLSCIGLVVLACLPDRTKTATFVSEPH